MQDACARKNLALFSAPLFCVAMAWQACFADAPPRYLDQMQVMQLVRPLMATAGIAHVYAFGALRFDDAAATWASILQPTGANPLAIVLSISLDEKSGRVCLSRDPADACIAEDNVSSAIRAARTKFEARLLAAKSAIIDATGMMLAIVRHEAGAARGSNAGGRLPAYFVSIRRDADRMLDLPESAGRRLRAEGIVAHAGAAFHAPASGIGPDTRLIVGSPMRRADGAYDVEFSSFCGDNCFSTHEAVLQHDASGWHVVSTRLVTVS